MAREKTFDESDMIEKAMHVFWEKGYAATSISDITEATGVKRGSLYNAYDGKYDLFMRSLLKYDREQRKQQLLQLDAVKDPREAIAMFFDYCVKDSLQDPDKKGCLLVNTALDYSLHDDEVQKVVSDAMKELTTFFENQIKRGQENGGIPGSVEPRPTARALIALLAGIRVLGRGTFGKTALHQISDQAKQLIS